MAPQEPSSSIRFAPYSRTDRGLDASSSNANTRLASSAAGSRSPFGVPMAAVPMQPSNRHNASRARGPPRAHLAARGSPLVLTIDVVIIPRDVSSHIYTETVTFITKINLPADRA